jgi:hypothetical protein
LCHKFKRSSDSVTSRVSKLVSEKYKALQRAKLVDDAQTTSTLEKTDLLNVQWVGRPFEPDIRREIEGEWEVAGPHILLQMCCI